MEAANRVAANYISWLPETKQKQLAEVLTSAEIIRLGNNIARLENLGPEPQAEEMPQITSPPNTKSPICIDEMMAFNSPAFLTGSQSNSKGNNLHVTQVKSLNSQLMARIQAPTSSYNSIPLAGRIAARDCSINNEQLYGGPPNNSALGWLKDLNRDQGV